MNSLVAECWPLIFVPGDVTEVSISRVSPSPLVSSDWALSRCLQSPTPGDTRPLASGPHLCLVSGCRSGCPARVHQHQPRPDIRAKTQATIKKRAYIQFMAGVLLFLWKIIGLLSSLFPRDAWVYAIECSYPHPLSSLLAALGSQSPAQHHPWPRPQPLARLAE